MDNLLIIVLLGSFALAIYATVGFLPTLLTKWRAATLGLDLTYEQAKIVTLNFCNKRKFLLSVREIWFWSDIPIEKLTNHFLAKGDLANLRDGIIEMKQRSGSVDFLKLSSLDLAGRDLKEEVKKAEERNWVFDLTIG